MNGLMSVAVVAVSFGIMIGLAVVVTAATRTARKLIRRRWQATRANAASWTSRPSPRSSGLSPADASVLVRGVPRLAAKSREPANPQ
jgi:hypothetical protein